jgi:hypothetical protein
MTWSQWFTYSYKTIGVSGGAVKDANGNTVSLDAVIVSGAVYNFTPPDVTVTITGSNSYNSGYYNNCARATINGVEYAPTNNTQTELANLTVPYGTVASFYAGGGLPGTAGTIKLNNKSVGVYEQLSSGYSSAHCTYEHVLQDATTIDLSVKLYTNGMMGASGSYGTITITD